MTNDGATRLSDRFNPATVRGALFVSAGIFVLAIPNVSERVLGLAFASGLLVFSSTDLWQAVRTRPIAWSSFATGTVSLVVAIAIFLRPGVAFDFVVRIVGVLLMIRGVVLVIGITRSRESSEAWAFSLIRSLLLAATGAVIFVLPESISTAVVLTVAVALLTAGGIMITYGMSNDEPDDFGAVALGGYVRRWLRQRDVGEEMRLDVIDNLFFEDPDSSQKQIGFWVLLVLSTTIATLGILADSTAVVIGAMLVAPLMTPILGVSAGIVNGWMFRVGKSFSLVAGGVAVSILTAWIVASWAPHFIPIATNSQVVSRVSPTLIDMLIAVAAGAAGAYATVDKRVSSSITGVAIAVALVPPLGVVGVTLTVGAYGEAAGAFLLFLTNLVSIILAASLVFVLTGFALISKLRENRDKMRTVLSTVVLGALIILLPLAFTSEGILSTATRQSAARDATISWLESQENLRLNRVEVSGEEVEVVITGVGTVPSVADLEDALTEALGTPVTATVEHFPSRLLTSDR